MSEKVPCELVAPGADACPALEPTEVILNAVALTIQLAADFALDAASGPARDAMRGAQDPE